MICVDESAILEKAKDLPINYLAECRAASVQNGGQWCFEPKAYMTLAAKFRKYTKSQADHREAGVPISGCCDRADQY